MCVCARIFAVVRVVEDSRCGKSHCSVLFVGFVPPRDRVTTSDGGADSGVGFSVLSLGGVYERLEL